MLYIQIILGLKMLFDFAKKIHVFAILCMPFMTMKIVEITQIALQYCRKSVINITLYVINPGDLGSIPL